MKHIKGNLLDTELEHIVHGCNAHGIMGAGVALAVRTRWPDCYRKYADAVKKKVWAHYPRSALVGMDIRWTSPLEGKTVHNLITQENFGRVPGRKYARYLTVANGLSKIANNLKEDIAIPKIGCSLGGLKWEIVEELLLEVELIHNMEFWVYEL